MALGSHLLSAGGYRAAAAKTFTRTLRSSEVYSEEAFHHVLSIERTRAQLTNSSFVLLLIRVKTGFGSSVDISPAVAAALFSGLASCLREVDFFGWHREGRIAGAVLAQGPVRPGTETVPRIVDRVTQVLSRRLPAAGQRLDVRAVRLDRRVV